MSFLKELTAPVILLRAETFTNFRVELTWYAILQLLYIVYAVYANTVCLLNNWCMKWGKY